jgi:hypothetical protein
MRKIHVLKIYPEFFEPFERGIKNFEIRKNDRNFNQGDLALLEEFDPRQKLKTGRIALIMITYLTDFAQQDNYVVFSFDKFNVQTVNEILAKNQTLRICRGCGCDFFTPCKAGCYWIEVDLCSACALSFGNTGREE